MDLPTDTLPKLLDESNSARPSPAYFHDDGKIPVFTPDYETFKDFYRNPTESSSSQFIRQIWISENVYLIVTTTTTATKNNNNKENNFPFK